jgi:hypothetical protein
MSTNIWHRAHWYAGRTFGGRAYWLHSPRHRRRVPPKRRLMLPVTVRDRATILIFVIVKNIWIYVRSLRFPSSGGQNKAGVNESLVLYSMVITLSKRTDGRHLGTFDKKLCYCWCQEIFGTYLPLRFLFLSVKFGHKVTRLRYVKSYTKRPAEAYNCRWNYNTKVCLQDWGKMERPLHKVW